MVPEEEEASPAEPDLPDGDDDHSDDGHYWADDDNGPADEEDIDEWEQEQELYNEIDGFERSNKSSEAPIQNTDEDEELQPLGKAPPDYIFCPLSHRLPIMRLYAKHASQHPMLPERHGFSRTGDQIWRDAVKEAYTHCEMNRLTEMWGYLWANWYCPKRWKLWARAAYPTSIPRKRTTMIVEALWRNLKRLVLHMYNRPPVDLACHALITKAMPPYRTTLMRILAGSRGGRAQAPTHYHAAFKRAWEKLVKAPIKGTYDTDTTKWLCNCGTQKYHAHLCCKHLVQACERPPDSWWPTVVRYHIPPFFTVPVNGVEPEPPESIYKHAWLRRMPGYTTDRDLELDALEEGPSSVFASQVYADIHA